MNGNRDDIEKLRDCLSILRDMEFAKLDGKTKAAIQRYAEETMEAILRPLYPKPSIAEVSESSSGSS